MWKRERHVIASTSRRVRSLRRRLGVGAEGASDTVAENTFSAAAHTRHVTLTMRTGRPVRELRIGRAPLYWLLWTHSRGFFARWHSWKLCVSNRFRFRGCLRSAAGPRKSLDSRRRKSFGAYHSARTVYRREATTPGRYQPYISVSTYRSLDGHIVRYTGGQPHSQFSHRTGAPRPRARTRTPNPAAAAIASLGFPG